MVNVGSAFYLFIFYLFFFINDIVQEIGCSIKLFADDTSIYIIVEY